jgi:hypothetical protein
MLTGEVIEGGALSLAGILAQLPVALLRSR